MLRRAVIGLLLSFSPISAWAQGALLSGGAPVPGQAPMYSGPQGGSQAVVQASGPAGGGGVGLGLTELLQVNRVAGTGPYGSHVAFYDNPTTHVGGYHYLSMDANASGGGLLAYGYGGGASPLPFQFCVNGTCYQFPFVIGGIVGPSTTVIGHVATWANTQGTLLADLGPGLSLTGALTIAPPAGAQTQGIAITQSPSGPVSGEYFANIIQVNSDAVTVGSFAKDALAIYHSYGGGVTGGASALFLKSFLASPSSAGNTNRNYVGLNTTAAAQTGDGGTGGGSIVNWKGAMFGIAASGIACGSTIDGNCPTGTPVTNLLEVTGGEINVSLEAGTSAWYKGGWTIAALQTDAVAGHTWDCELCLSNQIGAVGWNDAILVGYMNGQHPLAAGGTILRSLGGTYANGINLSADVISGNAWVSPGATISGAGAAAFASVASSGAFSATSGNFSGALSAASLTTGSGIITTGTISVTGDIVATGGISSGTGTFVGAVAAGNASIAGALSAAGGVSFGGTVDMGALPTSSGGKCVGITAGGALYISGATC